MRALADLWAGRLPLAVALAVHLLPVPYTVACAAGVWRSAGRYEGAPLLAETARAVAVFWAGLMVLA